MALFELNIDPFISIQRSLGIPGIDPVVAAGIAEIAGTDRIGISSPEGESDVPARLFDTVSVDCNWRIPVTEKAIDAVMNYPPDIVTFTDPLKATACLDLREAPDLDRIFAQIRPVSSLAVAVRIENDIKQVKLAYKLGADYIELNGAPYTQASSPQHRLQALENISSISRIANKYNMGVLVSGGINYQNFRELADLGTLDTLVLGKAIPGKALFIGLENALRDFIFLVK